MANMDIKAEVKAVGLKLWQVAEKLGIADANFSRKLRHELSFEEKAKIRTIMAELKGANR
jgi:predicted XRE-type DNA-binding protein